MTDDFEGQDEITLYDGCTLTKESKIVDLRSGCKWMGVSQAGSKVKMFERIIRAHRTAMRRTALEMAMKQFQDETPEVELADSETTYKEREGFA